MWKKATCLFLLISLLLLPSCGEKKEPYTAGGVACPVDGLEWGMPVEACMEALSLTEEEAQIERTNNESDWGTVTTATLSAPLDGSFKAYGYPVKSIRLEFYEDIKGLPVGLSCLTLDFGTSVTPDEMEAALNEQTTTYALQKDGQWISPRTLADADPALVDAYFHIEEGNLKRGAETYPYGSISLLGIAWDLSGSTVVQVNNTNALILDKAAGGKS